MSHTPATATVNAGATQTTQKGPHDRSHPVRLYVERVASQDIEDYPEWDIAVRMPLSYVFLLSCKYFTGYLLIT